MTVRVRIAPSPTGDPHVGTAYIAMLNWCFARRHGGQFILRLEDTDQGRCSQASADNILSALRWLGLEWDEGPDIGGARGPYVQSQRHAQGMYHQYAWQLVEQGDAYPCFCSAERLSEVRAQQVADKSSFIGYDRHCRDLDPAVARARAEAGEAHVIRMKAPLDGTFSYTDRLRGQPVTKQWAELDDQVLLKADGWPTYHLAAVVDDALMGITHVIRAEEWLNSLPKHIWLGERLGFAIPEYVHVGLLRNPDKSKISKRKNPTNLLWYKAQGFLPQAMLNFLALLGHSHPDEREFFDREELLRIFDLDRLNVGGPVFDLQKLTHVQGQWLRELDDAALKAEIHRCLDERLDELLPLLRPRMTFGGDVTWLSDFIFSDGVSPSVADLVPKGWDAPTTARALETLHKRLVKAVSKEDLPWQVTALEELVRSLCEQQGWQPKQIFSALRVALTGRNQSPPLFDTLHAIGQHKALPRLAAAVELLKRQRS
ncbi:MAG: glutamate--tRNA ligase [Planctomycetota bacterium]|nr:MAG: glutamate--tRNA ligase [Planctomycetota bacterium]